LSLEWELMSMANYVPSVKVGRGVSLVDLKGLHLS